MYFVCRLVCAYGIFFHLKFKKVNTFSGNIFLVLQLISEREK